MADEAPTAPEMPICHGRYDGHGRYAMDPDDDERAIQGFVALSPRPTAKPYAALQSHPYDGTWQCERLLFKDWGTGAPIVRLTDDPWPSDLAYHKGNWSADGQFILFRRRTGMWENSTPTQGPMIVHSDGTQLRNAFRDLPQVTGIVCSPTDPNTAFGMAADRVVRLDIPSGHVIGTLRQAKGAAQLKISPDGKYLLGRSELASGERGLWVQSVIDDEHHEFLLPEQIHDSYCFHPTERKLMFWYENQFHTAGFVQCDFDGSHRQPVALQFDWNHGDMGPTGGVHTDGSFYSLVEGEWQAKRPLCHAEGVEYYDFPHVYNGYLTWRPNDRPWAVASRIVAKPYLSELQAISLAAPENDVANRYRICHTGLVTSTFLDHPEASPDGTKILFNSTMFGQADAYYVVAQLPAAPQRPQLNTHGSEVVLSWSAPEQHREIAGYWVYGSALPERGFRRLNKVPVVECTWTGESDAAEDYFFVTACEHSRLESLPSTIVSRDASTPVPIYLEAEQARTNASLWIDYNGSARGYHYLWQRQHDQAGRATFSVEVKANASYAVWARVRGKQSATWKLTCGEQSSQFESEPLAEWTWCRFAQPVQLASGSHELVLEVNTFGSELDALALFPAEGSPADRSFIESQAQSPLISISAKSTSSFTAELSWAPPDGETPASYQLYRSNQADFAPSVATLIASPDRETFHDWGLKAGETVYYRVSWVDQNGQESAPSPVTSVTTPPFERYFAQWEPNDQDEFTVPRADTYAVWLELEQGGEGGLYVEVQLDGGPAANWTCLPDGLGSRFWFYYGQASQPVLMAGKHTLSIKNHTSHHLKSVIVTSDLSFRPSGHVNLLRGW